MTFQESLGTLRELTAEDRMAVEKALTGIELVNYEGADALVAELMKFYNGKIAQINTKFKNYPVPVGGILFMSNNTNPAEIYSGTTWELLATDKYLKTTTGTPLATGGSNSFNIAKANLPAEKLQIDSFQLGKGTQEITGKFHQSTERWSNNSHWFEPTGAFTRRSLGGDGVSGEHGEFNEVTFTASRTWTGMSTSATPYTQNLGSGTPISINPTYITVRAWKRLS